MNKRTIIALLAVFIVWSVLDFILHGLFLKSTYEATASLWRPMEEIKMPLMYFISLIFIVAFVGIYELMITPKSISSGITFGALFGLAVGISMGFGSYCYMPIPLMLAWSWFIGTLIESVVAGGIVGAMLKS